MNATLKLTFYEDPAHAWLEVSYTLLGRYGLTKLVSNYSYKSGNFAYLEEDCDAPMFLRAVEDAGDNFIITDEYCNHDSPIRSYQPYRNG